MSLTGNIEPIEDYGRDFEAGALQTSRIPVIFMDPKGLNGTPRDNPGLLRDQLDAQLPGLSDQYESELNDLAEASLTKGPFAVRFEFEGQQYCLINKPSQSLDEKQEIATVLSKRSDLPHIPGDDALWNRVIGIHEGQHCNQAFNEAAAANPENLPAIILSAEADADRAAIDYLETMGAGDVARALRDYRALSASADPEHATSALVDQPGEIEATTNHLEAAMFVELEMVKGVADSMGLEPEEAVNLMENNPRRFIEEVEEALNGGVYDASPELKRYVETYTEGLRRQVLDQQPIRNDFAYPPTEQFSSLPEGGAPGIVPGDIRDQMQIGGVSASAFFASHAHPELAQQRLDMQSTPSADITPGLAANSAFALRPGGGYG